MLVGDKRRKRATLGAGGVCFLAGHHTSCLVRFRTYRSGEFAGTRRFGGGHVTNLRRLPTVRD